MKRRLFTILSALSLLLFAAVVVTWVRSFQTTDVVPFKAVDHIDGLISRNGALTLYEVNDSGKKGGAPPFELATLPYAVPAFLSLILPLLWLTLCTCQPSPPGLCPSCGYDLRATPDMCPECGHISISGDLTKAKHFP